MGRIAGANMAGKFRPYTTVPYFWTMIFGKSLRYVGSTGGKDGSNFFDNVIIEGDFKESRFVAYYCRGDHILAVATVGSDPVAVACGELMKRGMMPRTSELMLGT
ncbi:Apoptosis-inducing factor 3, partial [Perkinsus olseni]